MTEPRPTGPVGRVVGTEDSTPLHFWVALGPQRYLQLDDVVVCERPLPDGGSVTLSGIVTQVIGRQEGAEVLTGGARNELPGDLAGGFYVKPTVLKGHNRMRVFQEEIFGPVVSVTTFKDDAEALAIANGVSYGLGSGLWTRDLARAHRFARELRAGNVWVNCYKRIHPGVPFGGVGESGYGREMGFEAMREYTTSKSVWINVDARIPPFYKR